MIFFKTCSAGNDFIHINQGELPAEFQDKAGLVRRICDRKQGAGADGVVFFRPLPDIKDPVLFEIFNCDGSTAEISGNGMAGVAAVLFRNRIRHEKVHLLTAVGKRLVCLLSRKGEIFQQKIEIGPADFYNRRFFPFLKKKKMDYNFGGMTIYPVSVGNPHVVILLEREESSQSLSNSVQKLIAEPVFPEGTNIEFVLTGEKGEAHAVFYERGVGPTDSSSTGSAAVFAVLARLNLVEGSLRIRTGDKYLSASGSKTISVENRTRIIYKGECWQDCEAH